MIFNNRYADGTDSQENGPDTGIPVKKRKRFLGMFGKKEADDDEMLIGSGSTRLLDVLSPSSIDLTSRDHIEVDGVLHA